MTRWLALLLGLGAAGLAVWALASRRPPPPLDDIDDGSRARLEQVLRDAESQPDVKP